MYSVQSTLKVRFDASKKMPAQDAIPAAGQKVKHRREKISERARLEVSEREDILFENIAHTLSPILSKFRSARRRREQINPPRTPVGVKSGRRTHTAFA